MRDAERPRLVTVQHEVTGLHDQGERAEPPPMLERRALVIASQMPYPPDQGGRIRTLHLLKALGELASVSIVCFQHEPGVDAPAGPLHELRAPIFTAPLGVGVGV